MKAVASYTAQLKEQCPDLPIESVIYNDDGQYNDVLIVNDAWVFRFATAPAAVDTLRREIAILHAVRPHLTLAVPQPVYANVDSGILGEVFVGYRLIPGLPLWQETFAQITEPATLDRTAHQLAAFLYELHHLPASAITPVDLPLDDTVESWTAMYHRICEKLFPHMRPDACHRIDQVFGAYLNDPALHCFEPCLRHGDFGSGNILYDPAQKAISGILDFGFTCMGDPAVDFAGLLTSFGRAFYERCCAVYPEMAEALPRVEFALSTFALQEALFGIENDDRDAFDSGLAGYR